MVVGWCLGGFGVRVCVVWGGRGGECSGVVGAVCMYVCVYDTARRRRRRLLLLLLLLLKPL
jgi:hypothetical protein